MAIGDVTQVTTGDCTDLSYVDVGLFETSGYGSVYVLESERPAIIDTGTGANYERVLDALDARNIAPEEVAVIALTHIHLDHAGGAGYLAEACPNATITVHEIGAAHLVDPERIAEGTRKAVGSRWQFYAEPKPVPDDRIRAVSEGDAIDLGDHSLDVRHAPGHAPHQVIYHDPANNAVFTGDAAGIYVRPHDAVHQTTPPTDFHLGRALADVETIREIEPSTLLFGHFGDRATGDVLDTYPETLADWVDRVAAKREEIDDDEALVEFFSSRTDLDDVWGPDQAAAETELNVRGVCVSLDRFDDALDR